MTRKWLCSAAFAAAFAAGCSTHESKPAASDYAASSARAPAVNTSACEPAPATLVAKDLEQGTGRTAVPLATALVHYTGWVYDPCKPDHKGAQFDSSVGKPVPFGFRIGAGRVIKGWDEGVPGMKEGGKRLLVIPAAMAYGDRQVGDKIPPNSTLVFEVNLVALQNVPGQPAPSSFDPKNLPK